jgi:hypothetical protein
MVQVSTEANARPTITAFTTMSADMNMPRGVRSCGSSAVAPASAGGTGAAGEGISVAAMEAAGAVEGVATESGAGWPCPATGPHKIARPESIAKPNSALQRWPPNQCGTERLKQAMRIPVTTTGVEPDGQTGPA